ncbi:MAG: transposase [Deltaproteobacteria bacterium]|nr:transposase [Deltaproteobacteria bacterium]
MAHRGPSAIGSQSIDAASFSFEKKTARLLLDEFEAVWNQSREAFAQERTFQRAKQLALSSLVCLGRHTVTGMLTTGGRQFQDWSADYRLFSKERIDLDHLFDGIRTGVLEHLDKDAPVVVAMDDTLLRKTGPKASGVTWMRDPLGPPFQVNLVRGQRILQMSILLPGEGFPGSARAIPIDFFHCPKPQKPKKNAQEEDWNNYRAALHVLNLNRQAVRRVKQLRQHLDTEGGHKRQLIMVADGKFSNKTILKNLPEKTTLIARVRKDTRLYHLPEASTGRGRKRVYGDLAPTPEELRQDKESPWETVSVFATGRFHDFKVKTLSPLRWRTAGARFDLRMVVIAPLAYRPRKGSPLLYRKPAYLICTDPDLSLEEIIQYYVWRWDIEVNFRDEKTILGAGQAQVRCEPSVELVPALTTAAYGALLLAAHKTFGPKKTPGMIPAPKWRNQSKKQRASIMDLINHLRAEMWAKSMGVTNFSGFVTQRKEEQKPEKFIPHLPSAIVYSQA